MPMKFVRQTALALALAAVSFSAHALFGDDDARRAILDLRQRLDTAITAQNKLVEDNEQMRRSLLDLQTQIETLRGDLAQSRGLQEQSARELEDLRQRQQEAAQGMEERMRKLESSEVDAPQNPDAANGMDGTGSSATASHATNSDAGNGAAERKEYDAAFAAFRSGDYRNAQTWLARFIKKYPQSNYAPSALFWLGNAQYATRNYKEAITNFRSLLTSAPGHDKAPEAMLSIASCQIELKDTRAARATLNQLVKTYPRSEAAQAARERLTRLR